MIACTHIVVGYGKRTVLHRVNFAAGAGEFVVILGPNGSGKTTLLHALTGIVSIRAGSVRLGNSLLDTLSPKERARRVAVMPQRRDSLPHMCVRDMVLLGRYPYLGWLGAYSPSDYAAVDSALESAGAVNLADRSVKELSGGECQRALLARALAQDTPVLLLDELAAGLDPARMVTLFDVLDARRLAGVCVVAIMHDVNIAALYATRLVGLREGRILFDGLTETTFTEPHLQDLYGIPMHVFPHPTAPVPQACPRRPVSVSTSVLADTTASTRRIYHNGRHGLADRV